MEPIFIFVIGVTSSATPMAVVALTPVTETSVALPTAVTVPRLIVAETEESRGESVVLATVPKLAVTENPERFTYVVVSTKVSSTKPSAVTVRVS